MKQKGFILLTFEGLGDAIHLPKDAKIEDVLIHDTDKLEESFRLKISWDKLPEVAQGTEIPFFTMDYLRRLNEQTL